MNRASWSLLFGIVTMTVVLLIGVSFYSATHEEIECRDIIEDVLDEKINIIVSDKVPIGCFIPPYINSADFNNLKDNIWSANKTLWDHCFNLSDGRNVTWDLVRDKLHKGIKLNGYCYDCNQPYCLCLKENLTNEGLENRRSINFVKLPKYENCIPPGKSPFAKISEIPTIFVVRQSSPLDMSLYGGVKLTGKKRLVGATGALYNGSTRISKYTPSDQICTSCFFGDEWTCYENSMDKDACNCHDDRRCYNESAIDMCKNYCELAYSSDPDTLSECKGGCNIAHHRFEFKKCYFKTADEELCAEDKDCGGNCIEVLEEDLCFSSTGLETDAEKRGCRKFQEFQNSVFEIGPMNYTIFKIGDIEMLPGYESYRGMAHAKVNLTIQGEYPGKSCYNINKYDCYFECCDDICEYEDCEEGCNQIKEGSSSISVCEKKCDCSTISRLYTTKPLPLCRTFCVSRDAFFENLTEARYCQQGCHWAAEQYNKPGSETFKKDVDLVFVIDTSGSMCTTGSNEWASLCNVINSVITSVKKEDYKVNVTIYALGENGRAIDCTTNCASTCKEPDCRYKILYCSDINSDLGLSLCCNNANCYMESWGPGAEWAVKNHPWREDILSKILFVVGDEGPYCGDPYNRNNDKDSVKRAAQAAIDNNVTIFGLWGYEAEEEDKSALRELFFNISEPTGGSAYLFDTSDQDKIIEVITGAIKVDDAFEMGYYKYSKLVENAVSEEDPYIYRNMYQNVYSNLIYILDWESGSTDWYYPYSAGNWEKLKTPSGYLDKTIELNEALKIIKNIS